MLMGTITMNSFLKINSINFILGASNGDPHITTVDDITYTMNGIGEYWLMKTYDTNKTYSFKMQARFEEVRYDDILQKI